MKEFKVGFDFLPKEKQQVIVIPPFVEPAEEESVGLGGKERGEIVMIDKKGQRGLAKIFLHMPSFWRVLVHLKF